ncbi:hypothetical protein WFA24289_00275 [Periweissella fabaria]|uniref:Holin n=1 Tax=Periweissella fabaria TaxID=546157 RepID=A0ABM8Z571_9LACO|nr:phage holin, LLH family [Periweissella fabaria]CAH0415976.1 hypothetical protein WFA24289_00275 [Periweissella fabaria]
MEQSITQLIEAIGTIIITALGGFVTAKLKEYATTSSQQKIIATLATLANAAVVSVEKSGILNNLTSRQKHQAAINEVQTQLAKAGLKSADETLIANEIERAYSQQVDQLHTVYAKQAEVAVAENQAQVANSAAQELATLKEQSANILAKIDEKQQAIDAINALAPVKED